jgi:ATP-binding cassette subfamily B protein
MKEMLVSRRRPGNEDPFGGTEDELIMPKWRSAEFEAEARNTSLWRMFLRLPDTARYLFSRAWPHFPGTVVMVLVTTGVAGIAAGFGLYSTSTVLRQLLADGSTPERLLAALPAVLTVMAALALQRLADAVSQYGIEKISVVMRRSCEEEVFAASLAVPLTAYDDSAWYDARELASQSGGMHVDGAFVRMLTALESLIGLVAMSATLALLDPLLLPALVVSVLPDSWAALSNARALYGSMRRLSPIRRRRYLVERLADNEKAAPEIRAYQAQPYLQAEFSKFGTILQDEQIGLAGRQARTRLIGRTVGGVGLGVSYALLGLFVFTGRIPLPIAGSALIAIQTSRSRLADVVLAVNRLYEESLYVNAFRTFLSDCGDRMQPATGTSAPKAPSVYQVENVSFSYPGTGTPVLHGVSLEIQRGETVALAGLNGSGKTTMAKLLAGLYLPTSGRILRDGVDLADVDPDTVFSDVAMVMQDPIHWPVSLATNIRIGRSDDPDPEGTALTAASEASGADDVAALAPFGWRTMLSKQFVMGTSLSGGQEQRVAIARALFRKASLLIADEPTASLDAMAEARIYRTLAELDTDTTCVLITHRMASVKMCSRIFVFDEGRIIAQGTHDQLMALGPGTRYHDLYQTQAAAYQDSDVPAAS